MLETETMPFDSLSFEQAVRLFQAWGFRVEPGPRPEEVTLIIDAPDHRSYSVHPASMLPQIASVALCIRWRNGAMLSTSAPWQDHASQGIPL